jgi:hypothetical protein
MLLHARSPLLHDQMIEVVLIEDPETPTPVVRTPDGLCLVLAHVLETYEVVAASAQERAALKSVGVVVREGPAAN